MKHHGTYHVMIDVFETSARGRYFVAVPGRYMALSDVYADRADAQAIVDWLRDRDAGYPPRPALAAWPEAPECPGCGGATFGCDGSVPH